MSNAQRYFGKEDKDEKYSFMNWCSRLSRCIVPPTVEKKVSFQHRKTPPAIRPSPALLKPSMLANSLWEKTLLLSSFLKPPKAKPCPSFFSSVHFFEEKPWPSQTPLRPKNTPIGIQCTSDPNKVVFRQRRCEYKCHCT